jgi:D-alanine-D-alanine ligase
LQRVGIVFDNTKSPAITGQQKDSVSREEIHDVVKFVESALGAAGMQTTMFGLDHPLSKSVAEFAACEVDMFFNLCEQVGENSLLEISFAGLLELLGTPYTGSGPDALALCLHKPVAKKLMSFHGIPTPKFVVMEPGEFMRDAGLAFPVFVKPSREDASIGISGESVAWDTDALRRRAEYIWQRYQQSVLVEEFIDGRELNVPVFGNGKPTVLPISEIDFSQLPPGAPRVVTYDAKWFLESVEYKGTQPVCPASLTENELKTVREIALDVYRLLGCRDYARVDMRLRDGVPYVLEVNPNPDISPDAGFARSVRTCGWTHEEFIVKLARMALERYTDEYKSKKSHRKRPRAVGQHAPGDGQVHGGRSPVRALDC